MSRNIMRLSLLTIFVAILHMSLVPTVWGQDDRICSTAKAAGEWGYVYTGTLFPSPTTSFVVAAVGRYTLDKEGNISGTQTRSIAPGEAAHEVIKGTSTVNSDCTGTATISVYDQSGNLLRTAVLAAVYVNGQREVRYLFESLVVFNGTTSTSIRVVITADAKRVFSKD